MIDFTCELSRANKKVLEKLDRLIFIYQDQKMPTKNKITLNAKIYDALNMNLLKETKEKQSLETHSYCGYELVRG